MQPLSRRKTQSNNWQWAVEGSRVLQYIVSPPYYSENQNGATMCHKNQADATPTVCYSTDLILDPDSAEWLFITGGGGVGVEQARVASTTAMMINVVH